MTCDRRYRIDGFTVVEVLILVAVLSVLVAVFVPQMNRRHASPCRINCINNLKQIGLAFRTWSLDNNDQFPFQVSVTNGGTMELTGSGIASIHFQVMSNELSTPKILLCPADTGRTNAYSFATNLNNWNISYFVGIDATNANPAMFLCGDRNITNGLPLQGRFLYLPTNRPTGWTHQMHVNQGNIGLADGSVQALSTPRLQQAISFSGLPTTRLAMP